MLKKLSRLANACLLRGSPHETISGRAHRERWAARHAIDVLMLLAWRTDVDHCRRCWIEDA